MFKNVRSLYLAAAGICATIATGAAVCIEVNQMDSDRLFNQQIQNIQKSSNTEEYRKTATALVERSKVNNDLVVTVLLPIFSMSYLGLTCFGIAGLSSRKNGPTPG